MEKLIARDESREKQAKVEEQKTPVKTPSYQTMPGKNSGAAYAPEPDTRKPPKKMSINSSILDQQPKPPAIKEKPSDVCYVGTCRKMATDLCSWSINDSLQTKGCQRGICNLHRN